MVMVDSVEEVQLNCCVLAWDLILPSIKMTQIIEVVVVECHGCSQFLIMHLSGSVMSRSAISAWYPDGDGGQCGHGEGRELCAYSNFWMQYYRDDTDNRGGGCKMAWELRFKFP